MSGEEPETCPTCGHETWMPERVWTELMAEIEKMRPGWQESQRRVVERQAERTRRRTQLVADLSRELGLTPP